MALDLEGKKRRNISMSNAESNELPGYLRIAKVPPLHAETTKNQRPQKKYNPEFNYGISFEAPTIFELSHTLINENTYKNPFLPYTEKSKRSWQSKNSLEKISKRKILADLQDFHVGSDDQHIENFVIKTKLPSVKTYDCVKNDVRSFSQSYLYTGEKSTFLDNYNKILSESNETFHRKKGLFSDFSQRNNLSIRLHRKFTESEPMNTTKASNQTLSRVSSNLHRKKSVENRRNQTMEDSVQTFSDDKTLEISKFSSPRIRQYEKLTENTSKTVLNSKSISNDLNNSKLSLENNQSLIRRNLPVWRENLAAFKKSISQDIRADIEKNPREGISYYNYINNHIIKSELLNSLGSKTSPYSNKKMHKLYSEENADLAEFERNLKFYRQKRKRINSEKIKLPPLSDALRQPKNPEEAHSALIDSVISVIETPAEKPL